MTRPARVEYGGAVYHVVDRGVERREIFGVERDHERFLDLCSRLKQRYRIELLAYCLMPNHYHLFLRTGLSNLHIFMKDLKSAYSKIYNRRCRRVGPLFQSRYKAILVENDWYALDVARYIHMNPVKARLATTPEGWRWSSYRQYLGGAPGAADTNFLLGFFSGSSAERRRQIRRFTVGEHETEYDPMEAKGAVVAGVGAFVEWVRREKIPRRKPREMSGWKELKKPGAAVRRSLERRIEDLTDDPRLRRKLLVYALKRSTPLSLKEIAVMVGMRTIIAVSQASRRLELAAKTDPGLAAVLAKLDDRLRSGQA